MTARIDEIIGSESSSLEEQDFDVDDDVWAAGPAGAELSDGTTPLHPMSRRR